MGKKIVFVGAGAVGLHGEGDGARERGPRIFQLSVLFVVPVTRPSPGAHRRLAGVHSGWRPQTNRLSRGVLGQRWPVQHREPGLGPPCQGAVPLGYCMGVAVPAPCAPA